MFLDAPFAKAASLTMALFDLLTSPAMAIAVTKLTSLFWAFQLHGWSYCIPCIGFAIHKMADLRAQRAAGHGLRAA